MTIGALDSAILGPLFGNPEVNCHLDYAAIVLDPDLNQKVDGHDESRIDAAASRVQIWVVPTNEELIVARQTVEILNQQPA